jgi:CHAD domain-containing protein
MKFAVDSTFQTLAARYLRKQIKQLTGQLDGIRKAEDIEFIHRARVATRRLRAGLNFFADCFPPDRVKTWRNELQRMAQSLGNARDQDVQIAFLCDLLSRLQELPFVAGVARVLVRWERRREKVQPEVVRAMRRLLSSGILREMLLATKKWRSSDEPSAWKPSPALAAQAEEHVLARLAELRAFEPCLEDAADRCQHHAMRIAAKRLRYTVEICRPMYAGRMDGVLESIKQVQSLLGEIHDCDVWTDQLDAFSEKQAKRLQVLYGHSGPLARVTAGIDYLRQDRCKRRGELFSMLTQYWCDLTREGLWEGLARTVRTPGEPATTAVKPRLAGAISDSVAGKQSSRQESLPSTVVADRGDPGSGSRHVPDGRPLKTALMADVTTVKCNPARN